MERDCSPKPGSLGDWHGVEAVGIDKEGGAILCHYSQAGSHSPAISNFGIEVDCLLEIWEGIDEGTAHRRCSSEQIQGICESLPVIDFRKNT